MTHSIWDDILFQARLRPHGLAVHGLAGSVSFEALARDVEGLATELLAHGLTPRDMVGLHLGFSYLHLLLVLALDRLGIASMSFATTDPAAAPPVVLPQFGLTAIVAACAAPAVPPCRWIELRDEHRPRIGQADAARLAQLDPPANALVRVTWTSGTTGSPKGVPMDRAMQLLRLEAPRKLRGPGPHTRFFAGMPLSSSYGYLMALAVLCGGGAIVLPNPSIDFVTQANALGVTATGATPAMLTELLGKQGSLVRRLETMAFFDVTGAHLPSRLARQARFFLTPNLWCVYGSTEGGWAATADAAVCIADACAVGYMIPWMEIEAVDTDDRPLPRGAEGILRIKGEQLVMGYHDGGADADRVFRGGWFYPGDLGLVTAEGLVRVTGRIEDMIRRDGASLSPLPLEEAFRALPGVRDVAVFGLPDAGGAEQLCAALVLEPGADAAAIRVAAAAKLGAQAPTRVFMIDSLPRNANGKLLRRELAEMARRSVKD
jgi:acyl-CoA synthetase (AMP-forming)/AMP-acid ligase II